MNRSAMKILRHSVCMTKTERKYHTPLPVKKPMRFAVDWAAAGFPVIFIRCFSLLKREGVGLSSIRVEASECPVRTFGGLADRYGNLDNGIIRVDINPDGTVNLTDHQSGKCYKNLLNLNDSAEIGDGWKHCGPIIDQNYVYSRLSEIAVLVNNPVMSRVKIIRELEIPKQMRSFNREYIRSDEHITLRFEFILTLVRNSREVDISLQFDNTGMRPYPSHGYADRH